MSLIKGDFLKSLVVLLSGTVIAQLLNIAFIPILSRIYTPDEIGVFNFYMQIVTFLSVVATLRMELAIPLEKEEKDRSILLRFTTRFATGFSVFSLLAVPVLLWKEDFQLTLLWLGLSIPLGILLHAFFNIGMYLSLANDSFKRISLSKLVRSGGTNGLKLGFGWLGLGAFGLVASVLLAMGAAVMVYFKDLTRVLNLTKKDDVSSRSKELLHKHRDFRWFNLPHTAVDLTRDLVLATFVITLFEEHDYGSYSQAYFVLRLPLTFVGEAIGQALFAKLTKLKQDKKTMFPFVAKLVGGLSLVALVPFTVIFFYGVEIFEFVLGPEWTNSGKYAEVIAWWAMIIFITSPLSFLPIVLERQRSYFAINIVRTLCLVCATIIPIYLNHNISLESLLQIVALAQIGINLLLLVYYAVIIQLYDKTTSE